MPLFQHERIHNVCVVFFANSNNFNDLNINTWSQKVKTCFHKSQISYFFQDTRKVGNLKLIQNFETKLLCVISLLQSYKLLNFVNAAGAVGAMPLLDVPKKRKIQVAGRYRRLTTSPAVLSLQSWFILPHTLGMIWF